MQFYLNKLIEIIPTTKNLLKQLENLMLMALELMDLAPSMVRFETIPTMVSDLALFSPVMDNDVEDSPALGWKASK